MAAKDECQRLLDEASELLTPSQQDWLLLQLIMKTPVFWSLLLFRSCDSNCLFRSVSPVATASC